MLRAILLSAMLLPLALPTVAAHACPPSEPTVATWGGFYVTSSGGFWQETNGRPGLQTSGGSCEDDNGRTHSWTADTRLL